MNGFRVRPYEERDWEAYAAVRSATYRGGKPVEPGAKLTPDDSVGYVVEREGRVVGSGISIEMTASLAGGGDLRNAGIGSVAVLPEERRAGAGLALMRDWMPLLREAGFEFTSLYAFRESFYRKAGYETCGGRTLVTVPGHLLPHYAGELQSRDLPLAEWRALEPCYEAFRSRYSGMNKRLESQWRRSFRGDPPKVYAIGEPVEAFLVLSLQDTFWGEQFVSDFVWSTPEGYRAGLGLMRALTINQERAAWYEPPDLPFLMRHLDHGPRFELTKWIMFRCLNVPASLEKMRPDRSGHFTLRVRDAEVPANVGPWRVEFNEGGVRVEPCSGHEVEIDIRALTQAILGALSAEELAAQGHVSADPDALARLGRLFTRRPVYCMDDF
ncbi:MAG: GNAT family N-acetyltransferase [Fimbriimonadaceae bacterium]|nr:GNAT family N-acetyltransferase [Fimbriimonadaceae bacterium]